MNFFQQQRASIPGFKCRSGVGACGPEVLTLRYSDLHSFFCFPVIRKVDLGRQFFATAMSLVRAVNVGEGSS